MTRRREPTPRLERDRHGDVVEVEVARASAEKSTVTQCKTCPWKIGCDPLRDIPNGYSVELHEALRRTIKSGLESLSEPGRAMACHYAPPDASFPCAGWVHNQLGPGNNIRVRLAVAMGELPRPIVHGAQHETFDDETLPKSAPIVFADRDDDDMKLPPGATCGGCASFKRCEWLIGCDPGSTRCDWSPSRYRPRKG